MPPTLLSGSLRAEPGSGDEDFRKLLDRLPNAAYTCDADGLITYFNQRVADVWGREPRLRDPAERYSGSHRLFTLDGSPIAHDQSWMARALRERRAFLGCEIVVERPDGSRRTATANCSPFFDDSGALVGAVNVLIDVTEQKQAEQAARRQTERMRLLWESAAVMLAADDPDAMLRSLVAKIGPEIGVDTYFNHVATPDGNQLQLASCLGISAEEAARLAVVDRGESPYGAVARDRRPLVIEGIQGSDDPDSRPLRELGLRVYAGYPLLSGDRLLGTLAFASRTRDRFDDEERTFLETLTRYVAVVAERLRLVRQLREEARRKDRFLATLAHELRNPLAPLRSAVRVLQLEHADERELRASRAVIERQVALLGRLVDDLLDLSRVTRDKLDLRMKRIDLADAIAGAIETSRPRIDHAGHRLIVELPEEPLPLQGDLVRLAQVFLNLLNNAAKYTEPGGEIRLSAARQDGEAVVRVRDNGVGIAAGQLPQLFEMFFQADHAVERSQDGLGIGLALVRRLVELHGGRVRATSDGMGKGSEFVVRLPLVAQPVRPGATVRRAPAGRPPESKPGRRILIVDDHRDSADSLALLLRLEGHEVHTAYDGERGVEAAERLRPDAVLLDLGMPGLGGHEVCRRIRARDWGRRPRLIAISGWGRDEDRDRAADAGFDGHLLKPFEPAALDALLNGASRAAP